MIRQKWDTRIIIKIHKEVDCSALSGSAARLWLRYSCIPSWSRVVIVTGLMGVDVTGKNMTGLPELDLVLEDIDALKYQALVPVRFLFSVGR